MDQDAYDDLLQRLTVLVIKMDESLDELKAFNREQVQINTRLETLITEVWRERHNGRNL
jgi:hypothetical protein